MSWVDLWFGDYEKYQSTPFFDSEYIFTIEDLKEWDVNNLTDFTTLGENIKSNNEISYIENK